jgi:salicylate hydroxylase
MVLTRDRHWATNEIVSVDSHHGNVDPRHRTARFHRADLQKALLEHVPASKIRLGKGFSSVAFNNSDDNLMITFTDGSTATADILLGADGINSAVRRHFVPDSEPKRTGWIAFRSVFDVNLLKDQGIDDVLEEANHWWGPDRTFFSSRLGKNLFTIVGGHYGNLDAPNAPYKDATWNSDGNADTLREYYQDWHPVVRKMVDATPYTRQYPNTAAPGLNTWTYCNSRVTLAGDAAHAHGGALAAGGSLAIDDAYAFAAAFWHVFPSTANPSTVDIQRALSIYERTRKAHVDRVISTVLQGNKAILARLKRPRDTDEELRKRIKSRSDPYWIHEHDVEAAFAQAVIQHS